jgi:hypothetical protein
MIEEVLSDADRRFLLDLLMRQVPEREPPHPQVMRLIGRLSGSDTVLVCQRAYLSGPQFPEPEPVPVEPLKFYDIDVEMRLRRTMRVLALNEEMAPNVARGWLTMATQGPGELSSVLKWTDGRQAYRPMPVETILPEPTPVVIGEPVEVAE